MLGSRTLAMPSRGRPSVSSPQTRGAGKGGGGAGGRRGRGGGEARGDRRGAQRTPHQDAAEIVLISIVFSPFSMRCTPVTFTLASVKSTSREFCGSAGLELTGM